MVDNNISASLLLKKSAKQLVYIKSNKGKSKYKPNANVIKGTESQFKNSKSKYVEMASSYSYSNYYIHFSYDEIRLRDTKDIFIEHKHVEGELPEWFLEYSILQVALYASLSNNVTRFSTARFFVNQGNKGQYIKTTNDRIHRLIISNGKEKRRWSVKVKDTKKILDFFKEKNKATLVGNCDISIAYKNAEKWDSKYRGKEFKLLKKYIRYKEIT